LPISGVGVEEHSRGYAEIREAIQHLSGRIEALDQKVSRQFLWLVGIQVAVLLAVVGALLRG
jgi:hypothetical protein